MGCLIVWFRWDLGLCSLSGCGLGLVVGGLPSICGLGFGGFGGWCLAFEFWWLRGLGFGLFGVGCGTWLGFVFRCGIALPIVVWWFGGFVWFSWVLSLFEVGFGWDIRFLGLGVAFRWSEVWLVGL